MARKLIVVDTQARAEALQTLVHSALGMAFPVVGVNAKTGVTAPTKQLTTEWVAIRKHPSLDRWALCIDAPIAAIRTDATMRARLTAAQRTAIDERLDALEDEDDAWFIRRTDVSRR